MKKIRINNGEDAGKMKYWRVCKKIGGEMKTEIINAVRKLRRKGIQIEYLATYEENGIKKTLKSRNYPAPATEDYSADSSTASTSS